MPKRSTKATEALATLENNPDDPDANLIAGRFLCFLKGEWEQGLPMLAKGSDAELKAMANSEFADRPDALALGDSWWSFSDRVEGRTQDAARQHAAAWYTQALPRLAELKRKLVESRLEIVRGGWRRQSLRRKQVE